MAAKPRTLNVCKICFNASSQKPQPTLTQESKMVESNSRKWCPNCKQTWTTITVALDADTNRWVSIRPRPLKMHPAIDYVLCTSVQRRQPCNKGVGVCTFAHSGAELIMWNLERWKEPRPLPILGGAVQYQLCKNVTTTASCTFGQKCSFAHSEEELTHWIKIGHVGAVPSSGGVVFSGGGAVPSSGGGDKFFCNVCKVPCTGHRQYEEHLIGHRHKQVVASMKMNHTPQPRVVPSEVVATPIGIRPRPSRLPVSGFRMCLNVINQRRCYYGNRCNFAHSMAELEAWNRERVMLRQSSRVAAGVVHHIAPPPKPPVPAVPVSQSGLDDFDGEESVQSPVDTTAASAIADQTDFAQKLRTTVMLDFQEKDKDKELIGVERTVQTVTISLCGDQSETKTILSNDINNTLSWIYEITSTAQKVLQSIVLFDVLDPGFVIANVELLSSHKGSRQPVQLQSKASQGEGVLLNQSFNPTDKIVVKISLLKPRSGLVGQTVLFGFGNFYMIRCLSVHVVSEMDRRLLSSSNRQKTSRQRPAKIDLFWDHHYEIIPWQKDEYHERGDAKLDEYPLPERVEELIESGKYKNVEQKVRKNSYVRRMHNLLYLEEYQERKDISRYDLYDVKVDIQDRLELIGEWINDPMYSFIRIEMDEILFEGGRSVRKEDYCLLLPNNQEVVHESVVHLVQRESIIIKITKKAKEACMSSRFQCSMRFIPSRIPMRAMHQAVDAVDLDLLFPESTGEARSNTDHSHCLQELERSVLNEGQRKAVRSMINPQYTSTPTLVLGPFGCGKTHALLTCVSLLSRYVPGVRILICTHTNSAADIYVEAIHSEWLKHVNLRPKMCRIYFKERSMKSISPTVLSYCNTREGQFYDMAAEQIMSYSIVVTTTMTARGMFLSGVRKGFFSHILIDEAAQVYEAELLIPLTLADKSTKIVLAGDNMQMDPPVHSAIAKRYGLNVSLLERLFEWEHYTANGLGADCKIHLTENHRSHEQILYLPSKLFYKGLLKCKAQFPPNGPKHIPALQFVGVNGHESQDEDSPSYYNDAEVFKIVEEVDRFIRGGLTPADICVIAYFHLQVKRIRSQLREMKFGQVQVHTINNVQGKEFRALIVSTVRTCDSQEDTDEGFLNNIKLLNTAITRAREWLIVVGEPITLCTVGYNSTCWLEFIKQCIELNTFRYPRSELFLNFLETKVVARSVLQSHHKEFIEKSIVPLPSTAVINPPYQPDIRAVTQAVNTLSLAQHQEQKAIQVKTRVLQLMQTQDMDIAEKIKDDILKLDPSQFSNFLNDEIALKHVRELELTYRNQQYEQLQSQQSAVQSNTSNVANMMGDLPSFLKNQVDSLTVHLRFCEAQHSISSITPDVVQNLQEQRRLLSDQMKLVNEQILKYREYLKITKIQPPNPGAVNFLSQMNSTGQVPHPHNAGPHLSQPAAAFQQPASIHGYPYHAPPPMMQGAGHFGLPAHMMGGASQMQHLQHGITARAGLANPYPFGANMVNPMAAAAGMRPNQYQQPQQLYGNPPTGYNYQQRGPAMLSHTVPQQRQQQQQISSSIAPPTAAAASGSNAPPPPVSQTVQLISPISNIPSAATGAATAAAASNNQSTWNSDDEFD